MRASPARPEARKRDSQRCAVRNGTTASRATRCSGTPSSIQGPQHLPLRDRLLALRIGQPGECTTVGIPHLRPRRWH